MREVKIEEYWPLIVKGTEEFGQIAVAENPEFNELSRCVYQVLKESFLLDGEEEHASEYGVSRWEKMLGLSHSADMSLDDRKAAILTYLSVKLPYTWRVLKQMLVGLLGEGNFELTFDNDAQKITIALASTVEHLREQIDSLIERVVPQNLIFEYDNGLPIDFEQVEYLESTGTQYSLVPYIWGLHEWCEIEAQGITDGLKGLAGCNDHHYMELYISNSQTDAYQRGALHCILNTNKKVSITVNKPQDKVIVSDGDNSSEGLIFPYRWVNVGLSHNFGLFCFYHHTESIGTKGIARIYSFRAGYADGSLYLHLTPALDSTGTPCLFDFVSRKPFYNAGSGDFLYPTDAAPAVSADLDETFYAKRTEHGIRRLYHVPAGYTGSKDQYAAEYGFKELVEPPMPLEGYWTPEWRETDTQLILEWVETEPPMEVTEND